jgi:uncharacterized membrane protein YdjX (TVP38/TMEM64 family)
MSPKESNGSDTVRSPASRVVSIAVFVAVIGAAAAAVVVFRREIWDIFSAPERLRTWVLSFGPLAPLVFVGLQTLQVVVFVIPGEVPQIAGGYLFGVLQGVLLSVAGIGIGSSVSFLVARALGVPFVQALFPKGQVERLRSLASAPRSRIVFFLLFVIPGIPKDILCYVGGLSAMRFPGFILISMAGRIPGIVGSAVMGDAAAGKRWLLAGIVAAVALALFLVGYLLKDRIGAWLERFSRPPEGRDPGPE